MIQPQFYQPLDSIPATQATKLDRTITKKQTERNKYPALSIEKIKLSSSHKILENSKKILKKQR